MIAYFKCLCKTEHRLLAHRLKGQGYEIRDISKNPAWRKEALLYKVKYPFLVENGEAKEL